MGSRGPFTKRRKQRQRADRACVRGISLRGEIKGKEWVKMKKRIICAAFALMLGLLALPAAAAGQDSSAPAGGIGRFAQSLEARADQLALLGQSEILKVCPGAWRYAGEVPCSHAPGEKDLLQRRCVSLLCRAADGHSWTADTAETRIYCRHDGAFYSQE